MLTITHVDTTSDLRYARVYISALELPGREGADEGPEVRIAVILRHELGQKVDLRYTPELQFIIDDSIAHGAHILDTAQPCEARQPRQRGHRAAGAIGSERERTDRHGDRRQPCGAWTGCSC